MKYFITLLLNLWIVGAWSQGVTFNEPYEVESMINKYVAKNMENTTVQAWRIQIISTDDRRTMERVKGEFTAMYPGIPTAWKHVAPYYQVRVGAYKSKTELMGFLLELKKTFSTAAPVVDHIEKIDFVK